MPFPSLRLLPGQSHPRFVHQRSGLQSMVAPLPSEIARSNFMKFTMHQWHQLIHRSTIATIDFTQKARYLAVFGHQIYCFTV